ncbi:hypothetical protein EK21DRAFT_102056 [Setomelanomma holmii]|uniref:Zn(2)-C6 fungal-type domain-containing protein n=1 Tax=Setomelanomma holmii TaxID=210430 RepID=A0A9P4H4K6_9PLEO|nr:hypothetical protein EK21DRAFT_102056 [Setomelanomma holmii]
MDLDSPRPSKKRHLAGEERQRAIRACRECRRLKEKCEGATPCKRCRHLRRSCEFNVVPALEERREHRFGRSIDELKDRSTYMERILRHHFPNLALDIDTLRHTCETLPSLRAGIDQLETSVQPPGPVANAPASESPGIEDENCTLDYVDGATVQYSGEFSHWNFSMHIKRNIDDLMAKSAAKDSESVKQVPHFIRVGEPDPGSILILDIVALLPPRPLSSFLVNIFFKHATSYYYYVDRIWYVHLESPKHDSRDGVRSSGSLNAPANWESDIGSAFYRQVARSLSEVIHAGTMLSVQVFLLMGLYSLPIDASGLGYIYLNLAIKVAIQNGMHRKLSRGNFDMTTKEIKRCIWWTAYCRSLPPSNVSRHHDIVDTHVGQIINIEMKKSLQGRWIPRPDDAPPSTTRRDAPPSTTRRDAHRVESRAKIYAHWQWHFLIRDCVSAANEIIDICRGMRMGGIGLAKSSYIEYSSCRASLLVLIAHSMCCRTNEHSSNLRNGLDAIKEMASVGESAQSEVSLLVTLEGALQRLQAFNEPCDQSKTTLETFSTQCGYEGLLSRYTSMAGSSKPRANTSTLDTLDTHVTRLPDASSARAGLNRNMSSTTYMPRIQTMDEYPFDLDLLNTSGNTAFFTSDINEIDNTQNEFFENLSWPPG